MQATYEGETASETAEIALITTLPPTLTNIDCGNERIDKVVEQVLRISPLQYVEIVINGKNVRALNDSGTQVPVVRRSILDFEFKTTGQIQLQGVVGAPVATPLVALDVKLSRYSVNGFVPVECRTNHEYCRR